MDRHEKNSGRSSTNPLRMLAYAGLLAIVLASASASRAQSTAPLYSAQKEAVLASEYGSLPLSFEKNEGQADPRVKFVAHGQGYSLSLTRDGALLVLHGGKDPKARPQSEAIPQIKLAGANPNPEIVGTDELPGKVNYILGNDPKKWRTNLPTFAQVLYRDVYPGIDLVFHGNRGKLEFDFIVRPGADPSLIQIKDLGLNALNLNRAGDLVAQIYAGEIVLKKPVTYQKSNRGMQLLASNFLVKKNGRIAFNVAAYDRSLPLVIDPQLVYSTYLEGAATLAIRPSAIAVDGLGEALIVGEADSIYSVTAGAFEATPPFQSYNAFVAKLNASGTALVYATYLGGANALSNVGGLGSDGIDAVAADSSGNAYLTGAASSLDFPVTPTAFQTTPPCPAVNQTPGHYCKASSAFVTVLNPAGTGLVYSTYFGGTRAVSEGGTLIKTPSALVPADVGTGIAVDTSGNIYITGLTTSTDFPVTAGAPQTPEIIGSGSSLYGRASFIAKFNPASSGSTSLVYSTCLGSSGGAYQGSDADTQTGGIAVDPQGNAYVTGLTIWGPSDKPFPTTAGAFETVGAPPAPLGGTATSFVTKLNSLGTQFSYSTFYQGGIVNGYQNYGQTTAQAIAVDASGSAYITGYISSSGASVGGVPTTSGAFQTDCDAQPSTTECSGDAFVAKFSPDGSSLIYSTYLGGSGDDVGLAIAVDTQGHAIVVGDTVPSGDATPPVTNNFPTTADALIPTCPVIPLQNTCGGNGFLSILTADGSALVYSTYLAGSGGNDIAVSVTVDSTGNLYVIGTTQSSDFPTTPGAFVGTLKQSLGGWALKFGSSTLSSITVMPNALPAGAAQNFYGPITFTQTGGTGSINWTTTSVLPTGITFVGGVLQGVPTQSGTFPITITATDSTGNVGSASLSLFIYPATTATISAQSCSSAPITSFDFGSVAVGTTSPQYICLNNTGSSNLYISFSTLLPSTALFFVSSETCNILESTPPSATNGIAPGSSCTVTVNFSPASVGPSAPVELSFADNAGSQTVTLTGTGLARTTAILSVAPCSVSATPITTLNFGNVNIGTTQTQTVCITNTGSSNPLYIEAIFPPIVPPFLPVSNSCPVLEGATPTSSNGILPGNSCQLVISFTPNGPGTSSGIGFQVDDNAGVQTVMLTGTGVTPGPTLVSIAVTPVNPTISIGLTQQFTATGTFSDSSTQNITNSVAWSSTSTSSTLVATIDPSSGLATAVAAGTSTIQATLGSATPGTTTLTVTTSTGGGGGTPACGCSKTGPYANPAAPGSSPNSNYTVSDQVNGSVETVFVYAGTSTNVVISTSGTALGSKLGFSPSGQYFFYENLTGSSSTTLQIFNLYTGKMVYSNSFTFSGTPGSGEDMFGVVGLSGFSPDNPETSFVYAFQTGQNSVQWQLVQLEQSPTSNTNGTAKTVSLSNITSAYWQFSPCGDVVAIVSQPDPNSLEIQLLRAYDGNQLSDTSGIPLGTITLTSTPSEQTATDSATSQVYVLANNSSSNLGCSAENTPPGRNVTVQPVATWAGSGNAPSGSLAAPVTLTFPSVNSPGGQITLSESNTGAAPPDGFALGNPPVYYDLEESPSTLSVTAPITICINYTGTAFTGQPALFHIVNGVSTPLTEISVDITNHIVCAQTPSLSPFAVFGASAPVSTTTALTSSLSSSVVGQTITLTAQITPSLVGTPTGTVTFSDGSTTLGAGLLTGSGSSSITTSLLPAGPNSITAAYSGDGYFAGSTSSTLALTVSPVPLTITANNNSRQYGASDPAFTVSYSGFVNGDEPGALSGTLTCTAGDTASTPVGTYTINCSGLSSPNYSITFMPGVLSITPASLTITANNASKVYGAANPPFTATDAGFVNGDTAAMLSGSLTCASTASVSSPVGSYPISCIGVILSNYAITFVPGILTVTPAALTIGSNNATRVYGGANPTFTASSSGFVNGDNASVLIGTLSCSTAATPASPVGTYPVACGGQSAASYSITYLLGQLSVTPAPLTITANNVSRSFGQPNPSSFGVSYGGFVNGDTSSSLGGALSCTTTAVQTSPVGTYPISCTGLISSNYAITFVPGTLTIIKEVLSATAKFVSIARASNGNYIVTIAVTNNGDITANKVSSGIMLGNLVIPGGSLGDKADISSTPALNVAPGATADITLVFPASAGKPSATRELLAYGFATAVNPNGTPVLPAPWVLQPAPTQVTLP